MMKLNVAPLVGRFAAWVLAWVGIGAFAAPLMSNLMGGGPRLIMTAMVGAGAIVGAIGGAMHAVLAALCKFAADESFVRRKSGDRPPRDSD